MTWEVFDAWSERSVRGFADQQVAAGLTSSVAALAYARRQLEAQLPDGLATPGHELSVVRLADGPDAGSAVGHLWLRVRPAADGIEAMVLDIDVEPALRGRGLGRATMLAAQEAAEALGATVLRLTVFGHNAAALALYGGLGLTVERALLTLDLHADVVRREGPALRLVAMTEEGRSQLHRATGRRPPGSSAREHRLWTAWDGLDPVGRLWLHLDERAAAESDGERRVGVRHLEVEPAMRGHGYGRALVAAAEAESRALGAVAMTVATTGADTGPRTFLERVGFRLTAQLMARRLAGTPAPRRSLSGWPSA